MSSDAEDQSAKPDETVDGDDTNRPYEPHYSEPSFTTSSPDSDWTVPSPAGSAMDESAADASAPDASPLMDEQVPGPQRGQQGEYWNEGGPVSGATSNSQPVPPQPQSFGGQGYGQQHPSQPAPGQQGSWGASPQQPHQSGPASGGMPFQSPYGGPMSMGAGATNPYQQAGSFEQGRNTLQLNYWLSAFFTWIPALIFYLTEKDKNRLVDEHNKELLNFNILRGIVVVATFVLSFTLIGGVLGTIASIALFILALMGAVKGPEEYAAGRTYKFPFTYPFIK